MLNYSLATHAVQKKSNKSQEGDKTPCITFFFWGGGLKNIIKTVAVIVQTVSQPVLFLHSVMAFRPNEFLLNSSP